jgi:EpsI family protein
MSDEFLRRRLLIAGGAALLAVGGAKALSPTQRLADTLGSLNLETDVPKQFDTWKAQPYQANMVINPQQQVLLKKIYSQILERTYRHADGYRVMLAIAYGGDQRDELSAHYPEGCYPSQGFKIRQTQQGSIPVPGGELAVRKLDTALGSSRPEPVTYWAMVGHYPVLGGYKKRFADLKYTLRGVIPDGLLFRVSSIDRDTEAAYRRQAEFAKSLLASVAAEPRKRLSGF